MPLTGNKLFNSPPSFIQKSSADAEGFARSGNISSAFESGSFNVGGTKANTIVILGALALFFLLMRGNKR